MKTPAFLENRYGRSGLQCLIAILGLVAFGLSVSKVTCAAESSNIRWGVVGHDDRLTSGPTFPYNAVSLTKQMSLINSVGLKWYRDACVPANCAAVIAAVKAGKINILESMGIWPDPTLTEAQNYANGYSHAADQAARYGSVFRYFEASNELDDWVGLIGDTDGSTRAQYNVHRYSLARGFIKGMIDGFHSVDPTISVQVNDAGWCHYGFLQALWDDGVRWDITAFHWYSNEGDVEKPGCGKGANVAEMHAKYGKPVWITEYNFKGVIGSANDQDSATWIVNFMKQLASISAKYNIQGAFVYELLDEPLQTGNGGREAHYGIFDQYGNKKLQSEAIASYLGVTPSAATDLVIE